MPRKIDLTNQKFGRLLVVGEVGKDKSGHYLWECECECGNHKVVNSYHLRAGTIRSCGCLRVDRNIAYNKETKVKHGKRNTRLYYIWRGIKRRTSVSTTGNYSSYGGRGITMCQEWKDDFLSFYNWSIANGYREDLSIERKDNNGPYSPDNCRWATMEEQGNNRRNNHLITHDGRTQTISQWAKELGVPKERIYKRAEMNMPVEKILFPGKLPNTRKT